jgi:hypothetical protein
MCVVYFRSFNNAYSTADVTPIQTRIWVNKIDVLGKNVWKNGRDKCGIASSGLRVEPGTCWMQVYNVTATITRTLKQTVPV